MVVKDGRDDFKRFFFIYTMITYLAPTSYKTVDLFKPLAKVNQI